MLRLVPALLALMLAATPALAQQVRTLDRAGNWEAFYAPGSDGRGLCGISQHTADRSLMLKVNLTEGAMFMHVRRNSWNVPRDARTTLRFLVDGREAWRGAFVGTSNATMIEGSFRDVDEGVAFAQRFAGGNTLVIEFLEGTESTWSAGLVGTGRIVRSFGNCVSSMAARHSPTQPFGAAPAPSQPFASPAAPAQPFAAPAIESPPRRSKD